MKTLGQIFYDAVVQSSGPQAWSDLFQKSKDYYEKGAIAVAEAIVAAGDSPALEMEEETSVIRKKVKTPIPEDVSRAVFGFWSDMAKAK